MRSSNKDWDVRVPSTMNALYRPEIIAPHLTEAKPLFQMRGGGYYGVVAGMSFVRIGKPKLDRQGRRARSKPRRYARLLAKSVA